MALTSIKMHDNTIHSGDFLLPISTLQYMDIDELMKADSMIIQCKFTELCVYDNKNNSISIPPEPAPEPGPETPEEKSAESANSVIPKQWQ